MTARAFLVRGLLAGLLAGLATFFVAHQVGEPSVEAAISLEEAAPAAATGHTHADGGAHSHDAGTTAAPSHSHSHSHGDDGAAVSRFTQRTWGLLTGTLTVGVALGGVIALVAAAVAGRVGRLTLGQSTAVVCAIGFVAFALVPFLKYPSTPPAVGDADTIGQRTGVYFGFLLVSLLVAVVVAVAAVRWQPRFGTYAVAVGGAAAYVVAMVAAGEIFPTVNELGDFPADTLWYFRRASLLTLTTLWAVLGVALTGLLLRLQTRERAITARRELAASL